LNPKVGLNLKPGDPGGGSRKKEGREGPCNNEKEFGGGSPWASQKPTPKSTKIEPKPNKRFGAKRDFEEKVSWTLWGVCFWCVSQKKGGVSGLYPFFERAKSAAKPISNGGRFQKGERKLHPKRLRSGN